MENLILPYLRPLMTLNRRLAPEIYPVDRPEMPQYRTAALSNGLEVIILDFPEHDILKIEAAFHTGRPEERQKLTALITPKLMLEGAGARTGAELAEHLDAVGASLTSWSWLDATGFVLTGLAKYADDMIPAFADVLLRPTFPQKELDTLVQNHIQELQVDLDKVEVLSYRALTECLYGKGHPLGYNSTEADYRALTRAAAMDFYQSQLGLSQAWLFVSGKVDQRVMELLENAFGKTPVASTLRDAPRSFPPPQPEIPKGKRPKLTIEHPGSLQASIKMGRMLFNRNHPDFYEVQILNTIFGGYFGSRLMAHIREDKGFTYNIYSGIDTYYESGYFYISTEVNKDKVSATLRAIRAEMKKLREQPVSAEELEMVRNYMTGALLSGLDGPLNRSVALRSLLFERIGQEGIERQLRALRDMTPDRLMELARLYLQADDFLTVVVR